MFEKYSKESFEGVDKKLKVRGEMKKQVKEDAERVREVYRGRSDEEMEDAFEPHNDVLDVLNKEIIRLHKIREGLLGSANKEASKMNEEYDKLLQRAREAISALQKFEREKLGMRSVSKAEL